MSTQTTLKEQFINQFDGYEGYPKGDYEIDAHPEDCATSDDDTIMYCRDAVNQWGIMEFADYHDHEGWSMAYSEMDDSMEAVYVFDTGSSWAAFEQVVIKADKLEAVASLLDRTPSDIANSLTVQNTYPVKIDTDPGCILIAPLANPDIET